jgi:predicted ATPase
MIHLPYFGVKDFRAFEGRKDFHFRDITFLIGPNSSGKSSLVDALNIASGKPLIERYKLRNIINKNTDKDYFTLSFPLIFFQCNDIGEFKDKFHNASEQLSIKDCELYYNYLYTLSNLKITLNFKTTDSENNSIEVRLDSEDFFKDLVNIFKSFEDLDKSFFYFFKPYDDVINTIANYMPRILAEIEKSIEPEFSSKTEFIRKMFEFNSKFILTLEEEKVKNYNLIFLDKNGFVAKHENEFNQILTNIFWNFEGLNKKVIKYKNGNIYAGELADENYDMEIESYFGIGMQRFIKLFYNNIETFKDSQPKIILIEEPEANLHPNLQAKLADLFVEIINKFNKFNVQLIVETHSEYLIRRMQYLIANTTQNAKTDLPKISPEQVNIYYFNDPRKCKKEDHIYEIEFLNDGGLSRDFGEGFFDASLDLMLLLSEIRNNKNN